MKPEPVLASVTDLVAFRRDRSVDNWFVALFVVCFCVFAWTFAAKVSPLIASAIWSGF